MKSRLLHPYALIVATAMLLSAAHGQTAADFNANGVETYRAGRFEDAIQYFAQAYNLEPSNETVRRNLCNAYQAAANDLAKISDYTLASDLLLQAISVDSRNPSPLAQLGSYYLRLDMVSDAVYRLEESLELDPSNLDVQELLGDAYYKNNDLPSALAQWEIVLQLDPSRHGLAAKIDKATREQGVEHNYRKTQSQHFQVSFAPDTSGGDVSKVLTTLERAYLQIGSKLGGAYPPTPIQVNLYTTQDFETVTLLGEHVGAVYDGKIRVPIRDRSGATISDAELVRRLYHEYTHVVVRYWAGENVPWWLNEGLAETFSNDLSQADEAILAKARSENVLLPLAQLEGDQLRALDEDTLQLAYRQAHATVGYLWRRYGQGSLADMLNALAKGEAHEDALWAGYRVKYFQLERDVSLTLGRA